MTDEQLQSLSSQVIELGQWIGCTDMFGSEQWDRILAATRDSLAGKGYDPTDRATLEHCFVAAHQCLSSTYYAPGMMRGPCVGMLWAQAEIYRRCLTGEAPLVSLAEMLHLPAIDLPAV